jgi:hypothetical protein
MKEQQKQYLIDIMKADEELGLYGETLDKKSYLLGYSDAMKKIDEFAIGFAEWIVWKKNFDKEVYHLKSYNELLEIFKKEKGL